MTRRPSRRRETAPPKAIPAPQEEAAVPPVAARQPRLKSRHLELWDDPAFHRRFTESYIAETDIEPTLTDEQRETMQKVLALMSDEKMDEAARLLERHRGASAVYDFTLANLYFQQEKFDRARKAYQGAVESHPKFRRAWRNLGVLYVSQGEFRKALPALIRVVELGGGDAVVYGLLGYAHSSGGNALSAESAYRMAILLDPETLDWKMGLAGSFFRQGRFAEAAAMCDLLIADHPDRADLWLLQANAYIGLDRPLKAAENYELVDHLGKSTADSLNMLGDIYINEAIYELAVNYYIRAMEKDPEEGPERAIRAAKVLTGRAAHEEALRLIERIEDLHAERLETDDRKDLLKLRARLAVARGAGEEEVRVLEEIVELDPLDGEALILLGQHSARSGEPEQAIFYYERAAAIDEYEADAKVRHAQLLVREGKYAEALPLLRRAQTLEPRDNVEQYLKQVERLAKAQSR